MPHLSPNKTLEILNGYKPRIETIVGTPIIFDVTYATIVVKRADNKLRVAGWTLSTFPGCCGVVVSTAAWVTEKHRKKGLNTLLNKVRQDIAKSANYGLITCTTISNNLAENLTLQKNGWKRMWEFKNPKTNHKLTMWGKEL